MTQIARQIITELATDEYTVTRFQEQTYIGGVLTDPVSSAFVITAAALPVTGKELEILPEGFRIGDTYQVISFDKLISKQDSELPDQITIEGDVYQVQIVQFWKGLGEEFYISFAKRVGS